MTSIKHKRTEAQLQRAISEIIKSDVKNRTDLEFVTITGVELPNDLSFLTVFVHFMNRSEENQEKILDILAKKKGVIKVALSKKVQLRKMPDLIFKIDTSFANADKIDQLLKEAQKKDNEFK